MYPQIGYQADEEIMKQEDMLIFTVVVLGMLLFLMALLPIWLF